VVAAPIWQAIVEAGRNAPGHDPLAAAVHPVASEETDGSWMVGTDERSVDLDGGSWGAGRLTCSGRPSRLRHGRVHRPRRRRQARDRRMVTRQPIHSHGCQPVVSGSSAGRAAADRNTPARPDVVGDPVGLSWLAMYTSASRSRRWRSAAELWRTCERPADNGALSALDSLVDPAPLSASVCKPSCPTAHRPPLCPFPSTRPDVRPRVVRLIGLEYLEHHFRARRSETR
jgi:hypothetical protein